MRRFKALAALTAGMMLLGGAALATAPTLTIDSPADGSTLTYTSFPQLVDVSGSVSRDDARLGGGNDHLCGVKDLKVEVFDGLESVLLGEIEDVASPDGGPCPTTDDWSFPWSISDAGIYTITVTARSVGRYGADGEADAEVFVEEMTVIATFPAAPSVAADLLHEAGASARYGKGKDGGNYIADVAHRMGPSTDFDGVSKREVAEYKAAVEAFLIDGGAF